MKKLIVLLGITLSFFIFANPTLAISTTSEITTYTNNTLNIITLIAGLGAVFFLIKGGYLYLTSVGKPDALENAKKTLRNALIGLVIVLSAGVIVSIFNSALTSPSSSGSVTAVNIAPINTVKPSDGLTQVLIDAVTGFMQNIVESSTKPIVDGILGFLTATPSLLGNATIVKFWLISLGIVDSLFVLVVALLGLHFMSASSLGFEEIELKHLLPKIGLSFLGANVSLFLADYVITTCNALVNAILTSTGGLNHAWIVNAINPASFLTGNTPIIILIFLILFLIIAIVLLLLYISRLIMISLAAVLSPFIFLLWILPKFEDAAEMAVRTYIVSVFMIFVHVVIIQLAASFLTIDQSNNSLVSIVVAIGLFFTLLKTPSFMMQMILYTSRNATFKKLGSQIINIISSASSSNAAVASEVEKRTIKVPRKVVEA